MIMHKIALSVFFTLLFPVFVITLVADASAQSSPGKRIYTRTWMYCMEQVYPLDKVRQGVYVPKSELQGTDENMAKMDACMQANGINVVLPRAPQINRAGQVEPMAEGRQPEGATPEEAIAEINRQVAAGTAKMPDVPAATTTLPADKAEEIKEKARSSVYVPTDKTEKKKKYIYIPTQ